MCTVHKTAHRLSCYMNIPKYSKLFMQNVRELVSWSLTSLFNTNMAISETKIVRETSVRKHLSGKVIVRETSCTGNRSTSRACRHPGNVFLGNVLSRKRLSGKVIVWEMSVTQCDGCPFFCGWRHPLGKYNKTSALSLACEKQSDCTCQDKTVISTPCKKLGRAPTIRPAL